MKNKHTKEDSRMEDIKQELGEEQLKSYFAAYEDDYVKHVRTAVDGYLSGTLDGIDSPNFTVNSHLPDDRPSGLDAFKEYFKKGKMIVVWLEDAPAGGRIVSITAQADPTKVLDCWVYRLADGSYTLRGIWQNMYFDEERMKVMREVFKEQLEDQEHAL